MQRNHWTRVRQIYEHCRGRIAIGHPNLLETLAQFRAYDDPIHKKSLFFLALMRNYHEWIYEDNEHLGPPVDYHEVRGHLRLRTISVNDPGLQHKLLSAQPVDRDQDEALRGAVFEAIMFISKKSRLNNPSQLHYLFWNIFRSVCTRAAPDCLILREKNPLPKRYRHLACHRQGPDRCPFFDLCASSHENERYVEHTFQTDYY